MRNIFKTAVEKNTDADVQKQGSEYPFYIKAPMIIIGLYLFFISSLCYRTCWYPSRLRV
jgi:hypothetical protein